MKNTKQFERFMNREIAIRVKDEDEFNKLMEMFDKNELSKFKDYHKKFHIYEHYSGICSYRDDFSELSIEDFVSTDTHQINSLVERVLVNDKATIVFFTDKTKQVVVHDDNLPSDLEKAVAMAIAKKYMGGYTNFKQVLNSVEFVEKKVKIEKTIEERLLSGEAIKFKTFRYESFNYTVYKEGYDIFVTWKCDGCACRRHYNFHEVLYYFNQGNWIEVK